MGACRGKLTPLRAFPGRTVHVLILSAMLPSVPYYSLCPKESPGIRDLTNSSSSLIVFSTSVREAVSPGSAYSAGGRTLARGYAVAGDVDAVRIRSGAASGGFMLEGYFVLVRHDFQTGHQIGMVGRAVDDRRAAAKPDIAKFALVQSGESVA